MKKMLLLLLFPILLIFLFSIESAEAKMYKCRNADGSVTYSDKRCQNKDSIENIKGATYVAAHQPPPDRDKCDALKKFAVSVAGGMQAGMPRISV